MPAPPLYPPWPCRRRRWRIARADAQRLRARRRIDLEPGCKFGERIAVGIVHPVRAEIVRHAENLAVGDAAPANPAAGLEQPETPVGGGDAPGGRDPGGTGADD